MPKDYDGTNWYVMTTYLGARFDPNPYRGSLSRRDRGGWFCVWNDTATHPTRGKARAAAVKQLHEIEKVEAKRNANQ